MGDATFLGFIFSLGLLSGVSPCSYPAIMMVATYTIRKHGSFKEKIYDLSWFLLGMLITLALLGTFFSSIGNILVNLEFAYLLTSVVAIIMGLKMLGIVKIPMKLAMTHIPIKQNSSLTSFLIGIPFTIFGSPCTLPVFITLVTYISTKGNIFWGIQSLIIYGIGRMLPILAVFFMGATSEKVMGKFFSFKKVHKVLGIKLITIGLYAIYSYFN